MIIEKPVYFVKIEGNLKQQVSQLPYTIIATYEEHLNKTYVIVSADEEDHSKEIYNIFSRLHEDINKQKIKLKTEQVEVKYSKNGIDFKVIV